MFTTRWLAEYPYLSDTSSGRMSTRKIASVGMFWISLKPEMRRPLSSTTGLSPPRPRSLRVSGESSCRSSVTVDTP